MEETTLQTLLADMQFQQDEFVLRHDRFLEKATFSQSQLLHSGVLDPDDLEVHVGLERIEIFHRRKHSVILLLTPDSNYVLPDGNEFYSHEEALENFLELLGQINEDEDLCDLWADHMIID